VGTVVNGIINAGHLKAGDAVLLGPDSNGNYQTTAIKTIQRKRQVAILFSAPKAGVNSDLFFTELMSAVQKQVNVYH
jgi:GTPase